LKQGSGTPLVFLHGFLGSHRDWENVVRELGSTCIAFDLPGHGASPFDKDFDSLFLKGVRDLESFHLIGYSMGGRLAAQFAARHPEKIKRLTLLSTHPGLKSFEERKRRLEQDAALAKKIVTIPIDDFLEEWYDQPLFRTLVSKMDIRSMRQNQNREALAKALVAFSLGRHLGRHLGRQKVALPKATSLVGEHDEAYRIHYRDLEHTVIPDAGHAIHLENPREVARSLYDLSV
jgi:2-succinyl-6-hydroxy-2,4-cyclohexadiene-1-carboxylate synthase